MRSNATSRCGLHCDTCSFREPCACGGCIETMGNPFHGACHIAQCCQQKQHMHCGECDVLPCDALYAYSYLDPEHGDHPPGARILDCRRWSAESGIHAWENVLLTSSGWADADTGRVHEPILGKFHAMLGKPAGAARVLFITAAAINEEARRMAEACRRELLLAGIAEANITVCPLDVPVPYQQAMAHDAIYVTGGDTAHLLRRMKATGFDALVKQMVYAGKVYVGVSAGSLIAAPGIAVPFAVEKAGLALINACLSVHAAADIPQPEALPLPHVPLRDGEALWVRWDGYALITDR